MKYQNNLCHFLISFCYADKEDGLVHNDKSAFLGLQIILLSFDPTVTEMTFQCGKDTFVSLRWVWAEKQTVMSTWK